MVITLCNNNCASSKAMSYRKLIKHIWVSISNICKNYTGVSQLINNTPENAAWGVIAPFPLPYAANG